MIAMNYTTVRQNFKAICDKAVDDCETIFITRERGENVVLLSEREYNNMLENLYVRSNPSDYANLMKSIEQLKKRKYTMQELASDE